MVIITKKKLVVAKRENAFCLKKNLKVEKTLIEIIACLLCKNMQNYLKMSSQQRAGRLC